MFSFLNFNSDEKVKKLEEEKTELENKVKKLTEQNETLEAHLEKTSKNKRIEKLQEICDKIPDGATGTGSLLVYQNSKYESVDLKCKQDLVNILEKAKSGDLEVVFV